MKTLMVVPRPCRPKFFPKIERYAPWPFSPPALGPATRSVYSTSGARGDCGTAAPIQTETPAAKASVKIPRTIGMRQRRIGCLARFEPGGDNVAPFERCGRDHHDFAFRQGSA